MYLVFYVISGTSPRYAIQARSNSACCLWISAPIKRRLVSFFCFMFMVYSVYF